MRLKRIDAGIIESVWERVLRSESPPPTATPAPTEENTLEGVVHQPAVPSAPPSDDGIDTACAEAEKLLGSFLTMCSANPDRQDLYEWVDVELSKEPLAKRREQIKTAFYVKLCIMRNWKTAPKIVNGLRITSDNKRADLLCRQLLGIKTRALAKKLWELDAEGHPFSVILTSYLHR